MPWGKGHVSWIHLCYTKQDLMTTGQHLNIPESSYLVRTAGELNVPLRVKAMSRLLKYCLTIE